MSTSKILIAEDSAVVQNIVRRILQAQHFEIDLARNGQEVLDKMKQAPYRAILMDINMPRMNGIECAKAIRALPDTQKAATPIIAITGNPDNYSVEQFRALGIDDLVEKPINFDDLTNKLFKLIG